MNRNNVLPWDDVRIVAGILDVDNSWSSLTLATYMGSDTSSSMNTSRKTRGRRISHSLQMGVPTLTFIDRTGVRLV